MYVRYNDIKDTVLKLSSNQEENWLIKLVKSI